MEEFRGKDKILKVIFPLAFTGISLFEKNYRPANNYGKYEIFMFNLIICWICLLDRGLMDKETTINLGEKKLYFLYNFAKKDFNINKTDDDLFELYRKRLHGFKADLNGLMNSNYPLTKQFLPAYTYSVIYYEQLQLNPDLSFYAMEHDDDLERMEELSECFKAIADQINWIYRELANTDRSNFG